MNVICISRTEFMIISCGLRRKFMVENPCECTHLMNAFMYAYTIRLAATLARSLYFFPITFLSQLVFIDMMCGK